jgi:hypothetical protein
MNQRLPLAQPPKAQSGDDADDGQPDSLQY